MHIMQSRCCQAMGSDVGIGNGRKEEERWQGWERTSCRTSVAKPGGALQHTSFFANASAATSACTHSPWPLIS